MLEGSGRRKVRPKERLLLQRVSSLPPLVGVGNSHDARAPAGAPSVRGFENHASLRVRRAIKKIETQRHRAIASTAVSRAYLSRKLTSGAADSTAGYRPGLGLCKAEPGLLKAQRRRWKALRAANAKSQRPLGAA